MWLIDSSACSIIPIHNWIMKIMVTLYADSSNGSEDFMIVSFCQLDLNYSHLGRDYLNFCQTVLWAQLWGTIFGIIIGGEAAAHHCG